LDSVSQINKKFARKKEILVKTIKFQGKHRDWLKD